MRRLRSAPAAPLGLAALAAVAVLLVAPAGPAVHEGDTNRAGWVVADMEIDRPVEEVYRYVLEPSRQVEWIDGLEQPEPLTAGARRVGWRAHEAVSVGGRRYRVHSEVLELEPNRLLTVQYSHRRLELITHFGFAARRGGTRLTVRRISRYKSWTAKLLSPLIDRTIDRKIKQDLGTLKLLLERRNVPPQARVSQAHPKAPTRFFASR